MNALGHQKVYWTFAMRRRQARMVLSRNMMIIVKNTLLNVDYDVASEICFQPLHPDTGAPLHVCMCLWINRVTSGLQCSLLCFFLRDVTVARAT